MDKSVLCSICSNVFLSPLHLYCGHTLCVNCVLRIKRGSEILCPFCRTNSAVINVSPDQHTEAMVDLYRQQQLQKNQKLIQSTASLANLAAAGKSHQSCAICNALDETVTSFCRDCKQYLCTHCQDLHTNSKAFSSHTIEAVSNIAHGIKQLLKMGIEKVDSKQSHLQQLKSQIYLLHRQAREAETRALQEAQMHYRKHTNPNLHTDQQEQRWSEWMKLKLQKLKDFSVPMMKVYEKSIELRLTELQWTMQQLTQLMDTTDELSVILSYVNILQDVNQALKSLVHLHYPDWSVTETYTGDANTTVAVKTNTISISTTATYKDLYSNKYACDDRVIFRDPICHISNKNSRLIITQPKGIKICSAANVKILEHESFMFDNIKKARASIVTDGGGYVVASLDRGLVEVDSRGKELCNIISGAFISINTKEDRLYSVEANDKCVVFVKRCADGKGWEKLFQVDLQYSVGMNIDGVGGCVIVDDYLYVAGWGNIKRKKGHGVSKHDLSGRNVANQWSYGSRAGVLSINDVDGEGQMLLCDQGYRRLQVFTDKGEWQAVDGITLRTFVPQAVTVSNNTVWVACDNCINKFVSCII